MDVQVHVLRRRAVFLSLMAITPVATVHAESRTYAIGMFHTATYSDEKFGPGTNCPRGGNGTYGDIKRRILKNQYGLSGARLEKILAGDEMLGDRSVFDLIESRGRAGGKPASIYFYPDSIAPTQDYTVEGRHAYGFDLDGKGADQPHSFEDPETKEKGVDNALFRAIGCYTQYNINLPVRPSYEESIWLTGLPVIPAWIFTITGADLSKDGDITVSFHKAIEHPRTGTDSKLLRDATYTIDPNPRSYGEFKGRIVGGVLTAAADAMVLEGETPVLTELNLKKAKLRLTIAKDGSVGGYIGGYQPFMDWWFMAAFSETNPGVDLSTVYQHFQDYADAEPDPKTGKFRAISATYRIDALPAFAAPAPKFLTPRQLNARNFGKRTETEE
jgi:hypothetical protein